MPPAAISPETLELLKKLNQLSPEQMLEVHNFIDFLIVKQSNQRFTSDISNFSSASISLQSHNSSKRDRGSLSDMLSEFHDYDSKDIVTRRESEIVKSREPRVKKGDFLDNVIIAPAEPLSKKRTRLDEIDFADINARFELERKKNKGLAEKSSYQEDVDWL
jgi:hypothetical protein